MEKSGACLGEKKSFGKAMSHLPLTFNQAKKRGIYKIQIKTQSQKIYKTSRKINVSRLLLGKNIHFDMGAVSYR